MALDFLNKMSGSLASAGKNLGTAAKNTGESIRLQNEIRANESKIQEHLVEIGRRYYTEIKEAPSEEYVYLVECIKKLEDRIADDKESLNGLNNMKRMRVCPECGAPVDPAAPVCGACGTSIGG